MTADNFQEGDALGPVPLVCSSSRGRERRLGTPLGLVHWTRLLPFLHTPKLPNTVPGIWWVEFIFLSSGRQAGVSFYNNDEAQW